MGGNRGMSGYWNEYDSPQILYYLKLFEFTKSTYFQNGSIGIQYI